KYYLSLANFQTLAREQIPFCWGGRGKVFLFLFSLKKKKGLNVFVRLVGHSANSRKSVADRTLYIVKYSALYFTWSSDRKIRKCLTFLTPKRSDLYMSYAVVRMQKMKSHDLKGIQFHNKPEIENKTNDNIDKKHSHENYDLKNEENINYNDRVKDIIDSQKTGTRKTRKDAVLVNELLITSDRNFFDNLNKDEQNRFFEESYNLLSERYGKQNVAYATVHNDERTPHMHMGIVPMRDGKLQGKNVFNRQELLWLQDKFPKHM